MKIQSIVRAHAGQSIKFSGGVKVKFDLNGIATVPNEVGKALIEKYNSQIFEEGKVVRTKASSTEAPPVQGKESASVEVLREKLQRANSLLNDYKAQLATAQDNERVWRIKCDELMSELVKYQKGEAPVKDAKKGVMSREPVTELSEEEQAAKEQAALKMALEEKSIKELQVIAAELNLSAEEYSKLSKGKLVDFLLEKTTKNANN